MVSKKALEDLARRFRIDYGYDEEHALEAAGYTLTGRDDRVDEGRADQRRDRV